MSDLLLHGKSGVLGGFSVQDEFKHQDLDESTVGYGLPPSERERLLTRGLRLMVDQVVKRPGLQEPRKILPASGPPRSPRDRSPQIVCRVSPVRSRAAMSTCWHRCA